jgi:hypothetical protein
MNKTRAAQLRLAIQRGLESIYRVACKPHHFAEHGSDLLWCFFLISSTSQNAHLRRMALQMGQERAVQWHRDYHSLPADADADTIIDYLSGCDAADKLGNPSKKLNLQIRRAAGRFTVAEFLCFDPRREPPPDDATERCNCGLTNERGQKSCRLCKRRLVRLNRYEACFYALTRAYSGECFGVKIGARYADVIKWLPLMRPYRGNEKGNNPEFYDTVYFVTHVVYTLNAYGAYRLSCRWLPDEFEFLKANLGEAIAMDDPEMVGEFLDSLKAFGLTHGNPLIQCGVDYLLSKQNVDGSWGDPDTGDTYMEYHPTWTAIDGLREYAWRGQRLSFPKLKPLLRPSTRATTANTQKLRGA